MAAILLFAVYFDFSERLHVWVRKHEDFELDELLVALALSSLGFSWYASRRWRDASRESAQRIQINQELTKEIAARQTADEKRHLAEALTLRLGRIVENSINEIYVLNVDTLKIEQVNSAACKNTGYNSEEFKELTPFDLEPEHTSETFEQLLSPLRRGEVSHLRLDTVHRRKDGSLYDVDVVLQLIQPQNHPVFAVIVQDISDRKRAEERLVQAQKMEAVGQLTGGIAHDFNNLLTVIQGNAELLSLKYTDDDSVTAPILRATTRGAELTQRLLAFSRLQPLAPKTFDLAALVSSMLELLKRTLGETIEIEVRTAPNLGNALADPGQVENALLNLALNARDAMQSGGKLTIECANAWLDDAIVAANPETTVGNYVVLTASDEGCGMSAEVRAHAFEPFFTTKEVGQGSGLGLSMIYGFAKQSGGLVNIYSEEGCGTTVKLYLPSAEALTEREEGKQTPEVPQGRGELILVIEDDQDVRSLAVTVLKSLDYRVIDVPDAATAQQALASGKSVDLVLSDVILPGGISGPEFAEQVRAAYPGLKVIFMSGYPAEAAMRNGFLGSDQVLLNKPFQIEQLAGALSEALG